MIAPQSTTQSQATMWKALVEAVEQKDNYTVLLRLKEPRFELLSGTESGMGTQEYRWRLRACLRDGRSRQVESFRTRAAQLGAHAERQLRWGNLVDFRQNTRYSRTAPASDQVNLCER